MESDAREIVLAVRDLRIAARTPEGVVPVVEEVSLDLHRGETLALVGESGSGKTMTALAILGLLPSPTVFVRGGAITYAGRDLLRTPEAALRPLRGRRIAMIFQEAMTSLNPVLTVGSQIEELLRHHRGARGDEARRGALELLRRVGIPDGERRHGAFAHELSAGLRQRALIAMALSGQPEILIADEPTTALDASIQAGILDLLAELQAELGMSLLWITHQLPLVEERADRVVVMQAGRVVESAPARALFASPRHAHTRELIDALPEPRAVAIAAPKEREPLIEARGLRVDFPVRRGLLRRTIEVRAAVDGVDLTLVRGRTLALVGESGSGKTTLGRALLQLVRPGAGTVLYDGVDLVTLGDKALRPYRRRLQVVFQDPLSSLDPRMHVGALIEEGMIAQNIGGSRAERAQRVASLLTQVGLDPGMNGRYPHELSGGQQQRVAIARSLAVWPELLVLDEATSALDLSTQARIVELLGELQRTLGLTYLFITHDLALAAQIADDVAVMYLGRIVERGTASAVFGDPQHPYVRGLLAAGAVKGRATSGLRGARATSSTREEETA